MSEKRFILAEDSNGLFSIFDNEDPEDEPLIYGARFGTEKVCDLLNEQQGIIEEKNNVITLMGAFIKNNGFSIDDFNEWISKDWHNVGDK